VRGRERKTLYILEQRGEWWRLRPEGSGRATARNRSRRLLLEQGTALGWKILDAGPDATTRDEFGRSIIEQDRDVFKEEVAGFAEMLAETSFGLAYAVGDDPPTFCTDDCVVPHNGPKSHAAISAAYDALHPLPAVPS
jgi:hypothetical protein